MKECRDKRTWKYFSLHLDYERKLMEQYANKTTPDTPKNNRINLNEYEFDSIVIIRLMFLEIKLIHHNDEKDLHQRLYSPPMDNLISIQAMKHNRLHQHSTTKLSPGRTKLSNLR